MGEHYSSSIPAHIFLLVNGFASGPKALHPQLPFSHLTQQYVRLHFVFINHIRRRFAHDLRGWSLVPLFNTTAGPSGRTCPTPARTPKFTGVQSFVKSVPCLKVRGRRTTPCFSIHMNSFSTSEGGLWKAFSLHLSSVDKKCSFCHFISRSLHTWDGDDEELELLFYFSAAPCTAPPIVYLLAQKKRTRPLKSSGRGSLFIRCVSINLWRCRWMIQELKPPKQTQTNTTCWNSTHESCDMCMFICCCPAPAGDKHHLKAQWETCGDMWYGWGAVVETQAGGGGGGPTPQHMFYSLCCARDKFTSELWTAHWHALPSSWLAQRLLTKERKRGMTSKFFQSLFCSTSGALWRGTRATAALKVFSIVAAIQRLLHEACFAKATYKLCTL